MTSYTETKEYEYRTTLCTIAGICDAGIRPTIPDEMMTKEMLRQKLKKIEFHVFRAMPHLKPEAKR